MKKLLLVLTTIISLAAKSQTSVYHPFPDSAIVWRQDGYTQGNCCCSGNFCLKYDYLNYFINGDTLIGAFNYNKIYMTGNSLEYVNGPFTCPPSCTNGQNYYYNNDYSGCIRQDTTQRTIYFIHPGNTQETLLYDFNLNVGDTLSPVWTLNWGLNYVTAIDSILIGGNYHRRFQLSCSSFPGEVSIIEGIGSTLGLLSPLFSNMNVSMIYNMLLCVTVNGIPVYPDTATACNLASQLNDVSDNSHCTIAPNPFTEKLNISLSSYEPAEVTFYDIASRRIYQQVFTNTVSLNTEKLTNGIYFVEVHDINGFYKKEKVVKY